MTSTEKIDGFILDIDGTLLDSTPIHLMSWKEALRELGIEKKDDEITYYFGNPTDKIAEHLLGEGNQNLLEKLKKRKTDVLIENIGEIPVYPKVEKILRKIIDLGGKIVFASSNFNRVLDKIYTTNGWDSISEGFVGIDNIARPKPDPEMIYRSLEMLGLVSSPEKAIMIGDSTYDLEAGKAAGTKTAVVCTKHSREEWLEYNPDLILKNFGQLYDLLPLKI